MQKYGLDNFDFEILEECLISQLDEKEKFYIKEYNSFFEGYNLTLGGDGSGNSITKEKVIGIIKDLEETDLTHKQIAERRGMSTEMVQGINTGRYWRQDRSYPIQKASIERRASHPNYCCDCGKEIDRKATRCVECYRKTKYKVPHPAREELKKLIREKSFSEIGRMFGVDGNSIRKWCDKENLPRRKMDINQYTDEEWEKI
jgi:group I intron endonuclease